MASAKKKTLSKDDLRRLMKEQSAAKSTAKRIDSPLAKYNSLGNLVCVVCNCQVKSEALWNAHVLGRSHKEAAEALRNKGKESQQLLTISKRKIAETEAAVSASKRAKGEENGSFFAAAKPLQQIASSVAGKYSSSEDETESDIAPPSGEPLPAASAAGLPADFFEQAAKNSVPVSNKIEKASEAIPEGFFDDPKQDAKIRQVEYRDKLEDEWEMFQKVMKEETIASEAIIAEEDEQATEERQLDEVDEQLARWARVSQLGKKKDHLMEANRPSLDPEQEGEDVDMESADLDELFDWRSKNAWT